MKTTILEKLLMIWSDMTKRILFEVFVKSWPVTENGQKDTLINVPPRRKIKDFPNGPMCSETNLKMSTKWYLKRMMMNKWVSSAIPRACLWLATTCFFLIGWTFRLIFESRSDEQWSLGGYFYTFYLALAWNLF